MKATERLLAAIVDLQHYITHDIDPDKCAACPRWDELQGAAVEMVAEVERLRAERDGLRERIAALEDEKNAYIDYVGDALGQDHDGETLWDAAQRVLSDRDRIRVERDELSEQLTESWISRDEQKARAEKAEAEVERLRAVLFVARHALEYAGGNWSGAMSSRPIWDALSAIDAARGES